MPASAVAYSAANPTLENFRMTDTAAPAGLPPFRAIGDLVREHAQARPQQLALR
jgi:hypothetical protein